MKDYAMSGCAEFQVGEQGCRYQHMQPATTHDGYAFIA